LLNAESRRLKASFRCSILPVPRGAGREWQSESSTQLPVLSCQQFLLGAGYSVLRTGFLMQTE
jgi:hypothetical protein